LVLNSSSGEHAVGETLHWTLLLLTTPSSLIAAMSLRPGPDCERYGLWLLKNSYWSLIRVKSDDQKCLEIREDRLYGILAQSNFCWFGRVRLFQHPRLFSPTDCTKTDNTHRIECLSEMMHNDLKLSLLLYRLGVCILSTVLAAGQTSTTLPITQRVRP
jgi:hypothetical protein